MALTNTTTFIASTGDGTTTAFSTALFVLDPADLIVTLFNTSTGVETVQTIGTHYTLSGIGNPAGCTVTFLTAPAAGLQVRRERKPAPTQPAVFPAQGAFPSGAHERALDRVTMVAQWLWERAGRGVFTPRGEPAITLPPAASRANRCALFDADGRPIPGPTAIDIANAQANAASAAASAAEAAGRTGWSPLLAGVVDGSRVVFRVVDWINGQGSKPASGFYIGPGGWVADLALATNFRGAAGPAAATDVTNTPAGSITATNIQAAINQLDTIKAASGHTHGIATSVTAGFMPAADKARLDEFRRLAVDAPLDDQIFNASGPWTKPAVNAQWALVELWGAGQGGGKANQGNPRNGGSGGAYAAFLLPFSYLPATQAVTVGAGGAGAVVASQAGGAGGASSAFGLSAFGGGQADVLGDFSNRIASATAPALVFTRTHPSAQTAASNAPVAAEVAELGGLADQVNGTIGNSAFSGGRGTGAVNGVTVLNRSTSTNGGSGADNSTITALNSSGVAGAQPSGGGSAGTGTGNGGNGGAGRVRIRAF